MLALETSNSNEFNAFIVCVYIILNNPYVMKPLWDSMSAMVIILIDALKDGNFIYAILSGGGAGINIRDFVKAL